MERGAVASALEVTSELQRSTTDTDVVARMALVETDMEDRFPGQLLMLFQRWEGTQIGR